jgi:AcrR family transcriptional regulator
VADTREQILDAARHLFLELGYDKTSLREVADEVGVTKAALYYHFRSKEDLLLALLEPLTQLTLDFVDDLADDDPERWAHGLEYFIDWMMRHRDLFDLIEHNEVAIAALSSAGSGEFASTHQQFHDTVDAALGAAGRPLEQRVQLMCALGVAISFAHFGRPFDLDGDYEEIRRATVDAMRATLGLAPADRSVAAASS